VTHEIREGVTSLTPEKPPGRAEIIEEARPINETAEHQSAEAEEECREGESQETTPVLKQNPEQRCGGQRDDIVFEKPGHNHGH